MKISHSFSVGVMFFAIGLFFITGATASAANSSTDTDSPQKAPNAASRIPVQNILDPKEAKVEAVADSLEYQKDNGKLIARGNAIINYQETKILADYAEVETDAKKTYARGHVMIFRKGEPRLQGEEIYYDFGNHTGSFPNARAISGSHTGGFSTSRSTTGNPMTGSTNASTSHDGASDSYANDTPFSQRLYATGKDMRQIREGVSEIHDGGVTTCNLQKPHYEIRCKKATLYADQKIVMQSPTFYVLGVPVFWLPYMSLPLNLPEVPLQAMTGHSNQYGYYLKLSKSVSFNKYLAGRAHIDYRSQRGFGAGWDQFYNFGKYAKGSIKLYLTQDKEAPTPGYVDPVSGQLNPYAQRENRERGRITWRHRSDIDDNTNILMRYHRASDEYLLQDFFEREFRNQMQPHSFLTANHNTEYYGAMLHVEKKMNSYESMVERLPEVRLDLKNQPLYKELLFNESRVQFDNLSIRNAHSTLHRSAVRTDAYNRWYMPLKWKDINFTPYAGYRATEYSELLNNNAIRYRSTLEYGADLRTHFYKVYDVTFDKLGIEVNQLRHVAVPSVTFQGTNPTISRERLIHFDTVDTIDNAANVIFGLENRLQTKRFINGKARRVDVVSLNTYVHFEKSASDPAVEGTKFTSIDNGLTLRPYEWLQFQTRLEYDFMKNYLKFSSNDMLIRKGPWKFVFGFRYMHPHTDWYVPQNIPKSQEVVFDLRYQLNKLWEVGGYIRYDTSTSGIQEYQVSATRDLHDFILEFGFNQRNSLISQNNYNAFVNFHMKGLPSMNLRAGGGRASFSEPRIGETVAGANAWSGNYGSSPNTNEAPLLSAL